MSFAERPRIKSFIERKNEEAQILHKKEQQVKQELTTIKNNCKFSKALTMPLNTLQNLISQENSDHFININSLIKFHGIKILCNIASVNINNEEIIEKVTMILKNMIKNDNKKTLELSKFFLEKNGQNDIFQLLINLKDKNGIGNLLEIIFTLIPIPQFFKILLDSEMVDTIKFLIEFNENNTKINNYLYKLITKITNHKKGRDLLLDKDFVKKVNKYIEANICNKNQEAVFDGLIILDNILKSDNGKIFIRELNTFKILGEGISNFFENDQILSMINKIYIKIISTEDVKEKLEKIKNSLNETNIIEYLDEYIDLFNYLTNFISVEDITKIICKDENIKIISNFFNIMYSIDLNKKNITFLENYISLMKYLLIIIKRIITYDSEKGKILLNDKIKIYDCIIKIFDELSLIKDENKNEIMIRFNSFFSEYCDIFCKLNKNETKNDQEISLLKYILKKIIINSDESFYKDEKINYNFSFLLKIIIEMNSVYDLIIQCFPYFKNVINESQNKTTLSNIFDILYNLINSSKQNINKIKKDIIPTIINFMKEKPNFRYSNLINLKILAIIQNQNEEQKDNKIDYIYAICSVMVKGYQPTYFQDIEKQILIEGSNLLKKLISMEFFEEKIQELNEITKEYNSEINQENLEKLKDNIIFHTSALNVNEFLIKGMTKILNNIKELINKEINFIENYKKEHSKAKEINKEYNDICSKSTMIINLCLNLLRKIEDGVIINFNQNKDDKFIKKIKKIIELNLEILDNSTDTFNLINHLRQLRKNIIFIINNESLFKFKDQTVSEKLITSLINLLRKNIYTEKITLEIIKVFTFFANNNTTIYTLLIKNNCPKLILQYLTVTNNPLLCYESINLIKNICLSGQKNLINLFDQNILNTLFDINTKFINEDKINNDIDIIVNEVKKLPEKGVHLEDILLQAIKNFIENMKNNFNNNDIKIKLLNDLIIINSYNRNKFQIKNLISNTDFINNFISLLYKTLQERKFTQIIDKLFTCEIELIKKILVQIPINLKNEKNDNDNLNKSFCDILLQLLFNQLIYSKNFLLTCTTLLYYITSDFLYSKFLKHKIDKTFIEKILEQEENYSDNLQIAKVVNKILSYLALKNSEFAKIIIKKGGFVHIIEDLKTLVNLNDSRSKIMKYNSLIMIDSLLNDDNNMDIFIQAKGNELINNILKNDANLNREINSGLADYYKCLCCINCNNDDNNLDNNAKKTNKNKNGMIANDIIIEEDYLRSSTKIINLKQNQEFEDIYDKDNNYILYCMKIINKCLNKNKKEFLQKDIIYNIVKLSEDNFPDKNMYLELIDILLYFIKDINLNKDFILNKNIIKILLSNKAYFYFQENLLQKTNDLLNKIGELIFNKNEYLSEFKNVINEKYEENYILKFKVFTYLSLAIDLPLFKNIIDKEKNEVINFFNDILLIIKIIYQKREDNNIPNFFMINKEGIILSLIKLYNYLISNNIINENEKEIPENINSIEKLSVELYNPNNYIYISEYEKEISKLINNEKNKQNYLFHLKYVFYKLILFTKDFSEELKYLSFNDNSKIVEKKQINIEYILNLVKNYYKIPEDKNIKEDSSFKIFEALFALLDLLLSDDNIKENYIKNKDITDIIKLIWKILLHCLQLDLNNKKIILEKIFNYDVFDKLEKTINDKINNKPFLRKIPLVLSEKNETNNELNELIFDFASSDLKYYAKTNEKIKKYDIIILSNITKIFSIVKLILQDKVLSQFLREEYSKQNIPYNERFPLSILFKNLTKNNNNLDNNFIQIIFSKILKHPVTTLEDEGKSIAENEIESVINIIKNKSLFEKIISKNVINNDGLKKISTIYDNLDINICKQLKHILKENEIDKKIKQSLKSINEDEKNVETIEKIVQKSYEKHSIEYIRFFDRMKREELVLNTIKEDLLFDGNKRILCTKDIKQQNKLKEKIKTSLSMLYNQKIYVCISEILLILIKNFNLVSSYKDDQYNNRRIELINKSLNILQMLSLTKDNHLTILEEGFINLLEKILDEYNSLNKEKEGKNNINEDYNKFVFNSLIKAKFILKECSQYDCAIELILDSSLFNDIINEIMNFNFSNNFSYSNNTANLRKIFIYNTTIIANIFSVNKFHEEILNKLEINNILNLGLKNGNIVILENIADIIIFYFDKNKENGVNLDDDINNKIFNFIEKCIRNKNNSSTLMNKIYQLISLLYLPDKPDNIIKIEGMKLIQNMNVGIKKYFHDSEYIYSLIFCLIIIAKDNIKLTEEIFNSDLLKNIRVTINNYSKEMPQNYTLIIWKITELYFIILKNKPEMIKKMCDLNITLNMVNYLDIYNNKVMPTSEKEKVLNLLLKRNDSLSNNLLRKNYVKEILLNCINYLNIITSSPEGNNYLSTNTSFNKYIIFAIENENNDTLFLSIALQCLSNYFKSDTGLMFLVTNIVDIYHLITDMQYKYYSDSGIIINMNNICDTVINSDKIQNTYVKNFFEVLIESIKFKEIDLDLIKLSLNIIKKSLEKNNYLIENLNKQFISNIINILKRYKDNDEIKFYCYSIISFIMKEAYISSFNSIIKDLLIQIKQNVIDLKKEEINNNDKMKELTKNYINSMILFISGIQANNDNIITEILIPFIHELNELNINDELELPFIINIFDSLFKNKNKIFIEPFINNNGIDKILSILKTENLDFKNVKLIIKIFYVIKNILKADDEYKIKMQNLKVPEIINNLIKLNLDSKIEFEGKNILFLINQTSLQLEKIEEVEVAKIEPVDFIGPIVKNYLTSGKQLKIINEKGEIKEKQLLFNQDLTIIIAKKTKGNLPPKRKYTLEINNIKSIIKGHGTNAFKKCKGLFKSIPKPENCFSIVGPLTGNKEPKAINVICNSEKDVDKWIQYMEVVINHFKKKKLIGFVNIVKETQVIK